MNDTNKKYYKSVYDKVHASDDLKERVFRMRGNHLEENQMGTGQKKGKKSYRRVWRAAAAAVVLAVVVPSCVCGNKALGNWRFHFKHKQ